MKPIPSRLAPLFVLLASVVALAAAYTAEYGFGLRPCELCLIQRVPFGVAGLLAVLSLSPRLDDRLRRALVLLAALVFAVNSGIAVYHVGVEQHLWAASCAAPPAALDTTDLAAMMVKPVVARCDEPAWQWHGITMAALNIVFSAFLAVVTTVLARRMEIRP